MALIFKLNRIIFISLLFVVSKVYSQNIIPVINFAKNGYDYIDSNSKKIISQYTYDQAFPFRDGLARISRNGYWGFINKRGEEIIKPRFVHAEDFSEGLASVSLAKTETNEDGYVFHRDEKYGMINSNGKTVIDFNYEQLFGFKEGLARAQDLATHNWSWIDKNGSWRFSPIYFYNDDFNELGLAKVGISKNYKSEDKIFRGTYIEYGAINKEGQFVIPAIYYDLGNIRSEFIKATNFDGKYHDGIGKSGYINSSGRIVIPFQFEEASDFSEGLAMVGVLVSDEKKFGFIDKNGSFKIPAIYDYSHSFSGGMAFIKQFNQFGWINKYGSLVSHKMYDMAENFNAIHEKKYDYYKDSKIALVSNNGFWGAISKNGQEVIPISYDSIAKSIDGIIAIKSNKQSLFDENGKLISNKENRINEIELIGYKGLEKYNLDDKLSTLKDFNIEESHRLITEKKYLFSTSQPYNHNLFVSKKGGLYGLNYLLDSTKFTEIEFDSLKTKSEFGYILDDGTIGFKKNKPFIISYNKNLNEKATSLIIPTNYSEIIFLSNKNVYSELYFKYKKNNFWGLGIIKKNQIYEIIKPIYEDIAVLNCLTENNTLIPAKQNGKWGFCNFSGDIEIQFQYQKVGEFNHMGYQVMKDNKWGYIDSKGNLTYPYEFEDISYFSEGICGIKKGDKWGFINSGGKMITPTIFNKITVFYEAEAKVRLNKMEFIIGYSGEWIYKDKYMWK